VLAFAPDAVAADATDRHARQAAADRARALAVPTVAQEVWRYSRIGELALDGYSPSACVTTIDGADGVLVSGGHDVDTGPSHDVFDELNAAFHESIVLRVKRHQTIRQPIVITHTVAAHGTMQFPRLVIDAEENSDVTVIERFVSAAGDGRSVVVPRLYARTQQAARLHYVAVNELSPSTWLLGHQHTVGDRDSTTQLATVALGGDYARVRTDAKVIGSGATTNQIAVYFAAAGQMHDFRTLQDHIAPRTSSDLLFKGAIGDRARSVYTGLIRIGHEAKGSTAYQTNRNLTLSEGAWAESVPNLEIETNDVKCSHASTVGPIDEDQRFYLESRGLPPELAERLVVLGFFDEVLNRLPIGALAAQLRQQVAAKLQRSMP
jgi:Fe-S cluster assembly protein SufD